MVKRIIWFLTFGIFASLTLSASTADIIFENHPFCYSFSGNNLGISLLKFYWLFPSQIQKKVGYKEVVRPFSDFLENLVWNFADFQLKLNTVPWGKTLTCKNSDQSVLDIVERYLLGRDCFDKTWYLEFCSTGWGPVFVTNFRSI